MSGQYTTRGRDTPPGVLGKIPPHNAQPPIPLRLASTAPQHVHGADNVVSGSTYEGKIAGIRPYADARLNVTVRSSRS